MKLDKLLRQGTKSAGSLVCLPHTLWDGIFKLPSKVLVSFIVQFFDNLKYLRPVC